MMSKDYSTGAARSNLKIVAGGASKPTHLRAGGLEPNKSMAPGEFVVTCEGGMITSKGKNTIVVLEFRVMDEGPNHGTALRQWITIADLNGVVPIASRYGRECAIALGTAPMQVSRQLFLT
jgi:hypothetical protein